MTARGGRSRWRNGDHLPGAVPCDPALRPLGEIVHDIDCKDAKFARSEAAGIALVVDAIRQASADDRVRLERGSALFDDLYARFRQSGA